MKNDIKNPIHEEPKKIRGGNKFFIAVGIAVLVFFVYFSLMMAFFAA